MLTIPKSAAHNKNIDRCGADEEPCIVCGKGIKNHANNHPYWLHTFFGGDAVLPAEIDQLTTKYPGGDSGAFPIGADCLRRHPELKPYLIDRNDGDPPSGDYHTAWGVVGI